MEFSFGTVNCKGNGGKIPPGRDATTVRFDLLQSIFQNTAALALQEVTFKTLIKENLNSTHHIYMSDGMGIVLKKSSFSAEPKFFSKAHFHREAEKVGLEEGRCIFACAKPNGWDRSILFVSYHGMKTGDSGTAICMLIKLCLAIKKHETVQANFILIGGDFNLPIYFVEERVLPRVNQRSRELFHVSMDNIRMVRRKDIIDYILYEDCLNVDSHTVQSFSESALHKHSLSYSKYAQLSLYLDHDPVVASISMKPKGKDILTIPKDSPIDDRVQCSVCGKVCKNTAGLKIHQGKMGCKFVTTEVAKHAHKQEVVCVCGKVFNNRRDLEVHQQNNFDCTTTPLPAPEQTPLSEHPVLCICGKVCKNETGLKIHQGKMGCLVNPAPSKPHSSTPLQGSPQPAALALPTEVSLQEEKSVLCVCGKVCKNETGLKIHQGKMGCLVNPAPSKPSSSTNQKDRSPTTATHELPIEWSHKEEKHVCICGKVCKNEAGLKIHQGKMGCLSGAAPITPSDAYFQTDGRTSTIASFTPARSQDEKICICGKVCKNEAGLKIHQGKMGCISKSAESRPKMTSHYDDDTSLFGSYYTSPSSVSHHFDLYDRLSAYTSPSLSTGSSRTSFSSGGNVCWCGKVCKNSHGLAIHQGKMGH